jgi:hypothetical protein
MVATLTDEQIIAELRQRIDALYRLNAELAAQCDRQGKVVDAAAAWAKRLRLSPTWTPEEAALEYQVRGYEKAMVELVKGGMG